MTPSKVAPATITAIPVGRRASGDPITTRHTYTIDRQPEPFTNGASRIWAANEAFRAPDGGPIFVPTVVRSDSIEGLESTTGDDPLSTARGFFYALILGLAAWAVIAAVGVAVWRLLRLLGWA